MFVTWVASPISATPVIRPRPAVISGIPAAASEPNVSSRMISAATHADLGGRADAEPLGVLDHLTARRDLQAGHVHRRRPAFSSGLPVAFGSRFACLS